jgi:hypothetical protein
VVRENTPGRPDSRGDFTITGDTSSPPTGLKAVQVSPSAVNVRVDDPRRLLRRLQSSDIRLSLPTDEVSVGFQMLPVSERMFTLPEGFRNTDIRPRQVLVRFETSRPEPVEP